jgi:hypothetical protein
VACARPLKSAFGWQYGFGQTCYERATDSERKALIRRMQESETLGWTDVREWRRRDLLAVTALRFTPRILQEKSLQTRTFT